MSGAADALPGLEDTFPGLDHTQERPPRSGKASRRRRGGQQTQEQRTQEHGTREQQPREPRKPADPEAEARAVVLRQLTMGARSRAQLEKSLARKGIPDDVSTAVLDRFEAVDLVDDAEFARQWVESRHSGRGLARRALAYELRQRGVAEETLKGAVEQVTSDDELMTARELVRRKLRQLSGASAEDPQRVTRRLAGLLARKGYSGPIAWQAIREENAALAETGFEEPLPED